MRKQVAREQRAEGARPLQSPLYYAFRAAAEAGDSRKEELTQDADGARVVSQSTSSRRRGVGEDTLKRNLNIDLGHLANTINLASVIDLDDHPAVRRSVLNYGIDDLTHLTTDATALQDLGAALRRALIAHEPRLVPETLAVEQTAVAEATTQRIAFHAHAEMKCRPVDIPLEFVAEIDLGSGKVELQGVTGPPPRARGNNGAGAG